MAALQTLRNKPVLLMSIIGGALLLFIITMVMESNTNLFGSSDKAGEVFGKEIKINDLNTRIEEEKNLVEIQQTLQRLNYGQPFKYEKMKGADEVSFRDQVWQMFCYETAIQEECDKLGLEVTEQDIAKAFQNADVPEVQFMMMVASIAGKAPSLEGYKLFMKDFDKDMAQLVQAAQAGQIDEASLEFINNAKRACLYAESKLSMSLLQRKYSNLMMTACTSNPITTRMEFDEANMLCNATVAALPYATVPDADVKVTDDDIKKLYEEYKENFYTPAETRSLKLIDVVVNPSREDENLARQTVVALEDSLRKSETAEEVKNALAGTNGIFADVYFKKDVFIADNENPENNFYEVYSALDSMKVGAVQPTTLGVERSARSDRYYLTFKLVNRKSTPDSLKLRVIPARDKNQADSLIKALKAGSTWSALAKKMGSKDTAVWQPVNYYVERPSNVDSAVYTDPSHLPVQTPAVMMPRAGAYVVCEVLEAKAYSEKFNVAIVKQVISYSDDTYNEALSKLSNFVANNRDAAKFEEAAKKAGFENNLLPLPVISTSDYLSFAYRYGENAKDAVRWVFDEAKAGQVSNVYESSDANGVPHLVVVAVVSECDDDYLPWDNEAVKKFLTPIATQAKKAEKLMGQLKNVKKLSDMEKVKGVQVNHLTGLNAAKAPLDEPRLAGALIKAQKGQFVGLMQGATAIYGMQVEDKVAGTQTYNATLEQDKRESQMMANPSNIIQEMITRDAKVKDKRYKF